MLLLFTLWVLFLLLLFPKMIPFSCLGIVCGVQGQNEQVSNQRALIGMKITFDNPTLNHCSVQL